MRSALLWLLLHGAPSATISVAAVPSATPTVPAAPKQWHGEQGGSKDFRTGVAQTQQQWAAVWSSVKQAPPQALRVATEMGVIVHLGERMTGGYGIRVLKVYVEDTRVIVEFTESMPAPGGMVTQALTQPWAIALVPRSELPVVFKKT